MKCEPSECPGKDEPSELVTGPGYAMYLPCAKCGVIHHGNVQRAILATVDPRTRRQVLEDLVHRYTVELWDSWVTPVTEYRVRCLLESLQSARDELRAIDRSTKRAHSQQEPGEIDGEKQVPSNS